MSFNYGLERKKFDAEWVRLRKEYAEAGMSKAAIEEMYQFDLAAFNRKRADANHEQPLDGMQVDTEEVLEDRSPLLMRFRTSFRHPMSMHSMEDFHGLNLSTMKICTLDCWRYRMMTRNC